MVIIRGQVTGDPVTSGLRVTAMLPDGKVMDSQAEEWLPGTGSNRRPGD